MSESIPNQAQTSESQGPQDVESLLAKIAEYESTFKKLNEKVATLENHLTQKDTELTNAKKRITELEELTSETQKLKAQRSKDADEVDSLKTKSEETLTKAKSMLFEKTKVIKNQELQIEALHQQTASLKDVVRITKDLLEIRNLEAKQLETKIKCMEDKVNAEKERHDLMHKKLETMIRFNGDLKREYETQLCLFSALRERYNERELAKGVVDELQQDVAQSNGTVAAVESTEGSAAGASDAADDAASPAAPPPPPTTTSEQQSGDEAAAVPEKEPK